MILDIVNIFLDLLPELILGAGPFCVFKGMGTGKDSGKLLFKKIYSDGGLTITEDSTSLDLTAVGGSSAINSCEIAFGDGVGGLASSTFKVSESDKTIYGLSNIGGSNKYNYSGVSGNESSIIVGGYLNRIDQKSEKSVIIGGYVNRLCSGLDDSFVYLSQYSTVILGGQYNYIISDKTSISRDSSIIGSMGGCIKAYSSTSIGSYNSKIYGKIGEHSRSFTSGKSYINNKGYNTSVIAGSYKGVGICNFKSTVEVSESLIIGSGQISVNTNKAMTKSATVIGYKNSILGSINSSISQGKLNLIARAKYSTILNGYKNYLTNLGYSFSDPYVFPNYNSSILNGKYNSISYTGAYDRSNSNSIIVHGSNNCIIGDSNAILNGKYNCIVNYLADFPCNNTIINGTNNRIIGDSVNSMIISGENLKICESRNSIAFSAGKIDQGKESCISGENNSFFQIFRNGSGDRDSPTNIMGKNNFAISVGRCPDGTEKFETSKYTQNSSILSLVSGSNGIQITSILGTVSNSAIIGSGEARICYAAITKTTKLPRSPITRNSVIVGACSSFLINACNSNILGGNYNSIVVACDSVIVGGYSNRIDGFTLSNLNNDSTWCIAKRSVILGGENHFITSKSTQRGTIIIGGSSSNITSNGVCADAVFLPNLDSCDKFSVYSSGVKYDGITGTNSTISSITVCNGILISWTP